MSLKPRKRDRLLGFFRSLSPSTTTLGLPSTATQSLAHGDHDSLSAASQSLAQRELQNHPVDLGSRSSPDRPRSPPINHQRTGDTGKPTIGEITIISVKESLKIVARISGIFPPLKTVAEGLVDIFERIDAVKDVQIQAAGLHEQIKMLAKMLEAYQGESPASANLKDRLDGLHRVLEDKRAALERKLDRSLAMRIVFSTEDTQFLEQALRDIMCSIEVTTFDMTVRGNLEISKMSDKISWINQNIVLEKLGSVVGAEFKHEDRQGCVGGTRVSILIDLLSWATGGDSSHVFWLNGMAGTGKTTIMETLCSLLNDKGLLGASFFCSIKSKIPRRDVRAIFPSIAKTLAGNYPRFREILVEVLATCSDPLGMNLKDQYYTLILGPIEATFSKDDIIVISIDALDECEDQAGTEMFLKTIMDRKPNVPLRFFVTGRPERHIREMFKQHKFSLRLHDIEDKIVQDDISIYLNSRLGGVRKLRQYYGSSWPPPEIGTIAQRAGNLFIYASTICNYISDRGDPCERLRKMASFQYPVAVAVESIEKLYTFILSEAFTGIDDEEASRIWSCLSILVSTQRPISASIYAKILGTEADLIRTALESLHSVITVPDADDQHISLYHASFLDYLVTRTDDMRPAHKENVTRCFRFMNSGLHLGISGAITSHRSNDDQPQALIVPTHLQYTCTAWGYLALQFIGPSDLIIEDIATQIEVFLRNKFLYWLEVLSVMRDVPHAPRLLYRLSQKVPARHPLKLILNDFLDFTNTFLHPIRYCAPHIYLSALPFTSPTSMVSKLFLPKFPSLPVVCRSSTDNSHAQQPRSILQFEGKDVVNCIAFSPDGKYVVSGYDDNTIQLWNTETGEAACNAFKGHEDRVHSVAFSPDGKCIASGSYDHTIRLWNIETCKSTLKRFEGKIATSVSFTSDGEYIVFILNNTIQFWNIETGEMESKSLESQGNDYKDVSEDGDSYEGGSYKDGGSYENGDGGSYENGDGGSYENGDGGSYENGDGGSYENGDGGSYENGDGGSYENGDGGSYENEDGGSYEDRDLYEDGDSYEYGDSHEDGEPCWCGDEDGGVDAGHDNLGGCVVAFSPDGKYVALSWDSYNIELWNIETGERTFLLLMHEGHTNWITCFSFSLDGKYLVSGSQDCTIRLWNAETGEVASNLIRGHKESIKSVGLSPDGKYIVSGSDDWTVRLWNAKTGEPVLTPFSGHTNSVVSLSFSPNGKYIVSGSRDYTIRLWKFETGEVASGSFDGHTDSINSVALSADGKHIVSGSDDCTIRLWNVETGEAALKPIGGHTDNVTAVSFSPDGQHIASGSHDGTTRLWNAKTGEMAVALKVIKGHTGAITSISFSPDGKHIASSTQDGTIQIWNVKTGEAASKPFGKYTTFYTSISFSPDGKHIASGGPDYTSKKDSIAAIQLWNIETGHATFTKQFEGSNNWVDCVAFSPDGKYIVAGLRNDIQLWNIETGETTSQVSSDMTAGHRNEISSVAFSPDGKYIISGSYRTIQLWTFERDKLGPASKFFEGHQHQVNSVSFSRDGKYIVSGSDDHTIRVYNNDLAEQMHHDLRVAQATFLHQYPTGSVMMRRDGWLQYPSGELMLWVPLELHLGLYLPGYVHIIGIDSIKIELSQFVHGTEWLRCQVQRPTA